VSFAIAPQIVTAAAEDLADIGSALGDATTAAAGPTTSVAAAAADDVSTAISRLFGACGRQFQALSTQAAAFHNEFVGLLRGGAAAYLDTEIANRASVAAATNPILGGFGPILGGGTGGGILGGLGPTLGGGNLGQILNGAGQQFGALLTANFDGFSIRLLPGLFAAGMTASAAGDPWQALFTNTGANLQNIYNTWAAHPFPVLHQIISNQTGYANSVATAFTTTLQNFPTTLANVPTNVELSFQGTSTFVPAMQSFINQQNGFGQAIGAALPAFGADLQKSFPAFENDLGTAGQALMTGDYHGAVQDIPRAALRLFLSGVDISNLSTVKVEGPVGDLIPLSSLPSEEEQSLVNLSPPGSIPEQIAQNLVNGINTSALPFGFAIIGPPIAGLDGLATGATAFGVALQTGNGVAAVGALADMPAYAFNGFLNGETIVDLTIPVTETVDLPGIPPLIPPISLGLNTPVVVHLPFDGVLTPPQQIQVTVESATGPFTVPLVELGFGGTQYGGLFPELVNYIPEQIAAAITPQ
jgi:PE family